MKCLSQEIYNLVIAVRADKKKKHKYKYEGYVYEYYGYYFNTDGIFTECKLDSLSSNIDTRFVEKDHFDTYSLDLDKDYILKYNIRLLPSAVKKCIRDLSIGDNIQKLDDALYAAYSAPHKDRYGKHNAYDINDFIASISQPHCERRPDNKNTKTFDYIRIYVNCCDVKNYKEFAKKHYKQIARCVVDSLKKSKRFLKYGVPVNFLKLTNITILNDKSIEFIFELKDII